MIMEIDELQQQLAAQGYKMTQPRKAILAALLRRTGWVTAKLLHQEVSTSAAPIDFSTVCRNLDTLTNLGVLCRVDRECNGIFAYCLRETDEHHHHLICRSCGKISPLNFCPLSQLNSPLTNGYSELKCVFEVYGTCHDCQSKG